MTGCHTRETRRIIKSFMGKIIVIYILLEVNFVSLTQIPNDTDIKYYSGHLVIDTPKPIHLSIGHISKAEVFQYSLEKADMLIELLIVLQYNIQICIYNI